MNLLFYLYKYCYPPVGGTHIRSYSLIKELSKNHNVHVVAQTYFDVKQKDIDKMKEFCKTVEIVRIHSQNSIPLFLKSLITGIPYKVLCNESQESFNKINKIIEDNNIDILIPDYVFLANKAIINLDVNKCMLAPNLEYVLLKRYSKHGSIIRRLYGMSQWKKIMEYEFEGYRNFDMTVLVSKNDEDKIKSIAPEINTGVVENGIDGKYLCSKREKKPSPPNLIYAGAMWYYPNIEAMLFMANKILPMIRKEVPDITFTIVGEKPTKEIRKLNDIDGITVTGWVPDVRPYIDNASVYVVPLSIGSGVRYKIFEALAMKIPVVSTKSACEGHDATHGKDIMIANSPEEFARHTIDLIKDKELWNKISSGGREHVTTRYNWEVSAKNFESILQNII